MDSAKDKKKIIIADDNEDICKVLSEILSGEGYEVECVNNGFALIEYLKKNQDMDVVILDLIMPEKAGTSIFDTIRSVSPASKLIIYTGCSEYENSIFAREADAFMSKTAGADKLIETIKKLVE